MAAAGRMHTYLASATLSYIRDGAPKSRQMNQLIAIEENRITLTSLNIARGEMIQRLKAEMGVPEEDVKDFIYNSISYLGHMSEREFTGQAKRSIEPLPAQTYHS